MGRSKAGRKRKDGKRTESGQLSRAGRNVQPSEWVAKRRARFGEYYNSALGRVYASGLLGDGNEAKERYDTSRKFAALYRRLIGRDRYRCALDTSPRGSTGDDLSDARAEKEAHDTEWLLEAMRKMDATGCRPFFDQLICHTFTDYGPPWADRLLDGPKDRRDTMVLDAAIMAIDAMIGERRLVERIRVA